MTERLPDFLIIGAGKSGTTSLDNYLKQHPDIFVSQVKEPNFFALEGLSIPKNDPDQFFHFPWSVTTLEKYRELFQNARPGQMVGETSPMYLYGERAPANIKKYVPNAKLVVILRQPADRVYSRYMHLAQEHRVPGKGFEDIFNRDGVWWKRNDLVNEGFYHKHLSRYFELFPLSNILVILYEELNKNRDKTVRDIFSFLGVRSDITIDTRPEFNPSGLIKNKFIDRIIGKRSPIFSTLSKLSPSLYEKLKTNPTLGRYFYQMRKKNLEKPYFDPVMRARITNEIYREDILQLQKLIDKDLSHWLA
jgi:hypothetical protein